ncbi:MAG: hypothetical protein Q9181_001351 [Wetmoreana brouardii]
MLDNSHLGARGDPGGSTSSWSNFTNETWSINAGFEGLTHADPALHGEPKSPPISWMNEEGNYLNSWAAIDHEQGHDHGQQATLPVVDNTAADLSHTNAPYGGRAVFGNHTAPFDPICPFLRNPRIQLQLANFDQAYRYDPVPGQQLASTISDVPRWFPVADDTIAGPWPSQFLSSQEIHHDSCSASLLCEPAIELDAGLLNDQDRILSGDDGEELDLDRHQNPHAYPGLSAVPDESIDPPASPDPVGPPSQLPARGRSLSSRKASRSAVARVQRHDPLMSRIRLAESQTASLAQQHDLDKLRAFTSQRVYRYLDNHLLVFVTWGYFRPIKCDVTEIESRGPSLLFQNQYRLNETGQYDRVQVPSPPLGMILMAVDEWRARLDGYLEEALEKSFWGFPEACFRGEDCRIERDFLLPIFNYHNGATTNKARTLVHQSLKLVVLTYIMTHSLTLVEDTKDDVHKQLLHPPATKFGIHTCPRWLNKQIKFLLSTLHHDLLKDVLNRVQDALRFSNTKSVWAALFSSMVILAMTNETLELSVRCKEETDKEEGVIHRDDRTADEAINLMDKKFELLKYLFHQRYRTLSSNGLNPLQSVTDCLDDASQILAAKASEIVETYRSFLIARQALPAPSTTRDPQTSRLIAGFLLCFSPPAEQHQHQPAVPASRK